MQINHDQIIEEAKQKVLSLIDMKPDQKWHLESNKDGFTIHSLENPANGLKINRTETNSDVDPESFIRFVVDMTRKKEYDPNFIEGKLVQQVDENTYIYYFRGKAPVMFVDGRDFCVLTKIIKLDEGSWQTITRSIELPDHPPIKGTVRGEVVFNSWTVKKLPNGQTNIITIGNVDPKGDLPKAVINMGSKMQAEGMKKAIEHFKKQKK